jgi:pimeloyl-ACP methyl ester carboxylesterase
VFRLNVDLYPRSANTYDSYAEALLKDGDKEAAKSNYRRSLEFDPGNRNAAGVLARLRFEDGDTLISAGKVRLNFSVIKGGKVTVLFEAGGGDDSRDWVDLAPEVARRTGATVVSYDRAGFGKSDLPAEPHDIRLETGWLWRCLQQLGRDRDLVLVGWSYGGMFVRMIASEHPEAIKGMLLIDPYSPEFVELAGVDKIDEYYRPKQLEWLGAGPSDDLQALLSDSARIGALDRSKRALARMIEGGARRQLEFMKGTSIPKGIPTVLITSGLPFWPLELQESWRPSHEKMVEALPGARLIVAEKSDHMIPLKQPGLIVDALDELVRSEK